MGFGLMMAPRDHWDKEAQRKSSRMETRDYRDGYEDAMEEMRRRRSRGMLWDDGAEDNTRRYWEPDEMRRDPRQEEEMRRGRRRRGRGEMEMRGRPIGFGTKDDSMTQEMGGISDTVPFDPSMESVLEHADHLIKTPPSTWPPYIQRGDFLGIAKMEAKELMKALESGKGAGDIKKELTHTLAALMLLAKQ